MLSTTDTEYTETNEEPDPTSLREDVALTIGRELLPALDGVDVKIDVREWDQYLSQQLGRQLIIKARDLPPEALTALGERGYSLTPRRDDDSGRVKGYAIYIPEETIQRFREYADARGEPHPAPPKTDTRYTLTVSNRWKPLPDSNPADMEPLPHPVVSPDEFNMKLHQFNE